MSKFNALISSALRTINLAGGEAFRQPEKTEFASLLLTSFAASQFYRDENETLARVKKLARGISDKRFVAKAAIYARREFGMRSVSHAVAAELAAVVKGEAWLKTFFTAVVLRPDDITEILAYYLATYGAPVPNAMKKGLGAAFEKFDAYQLAKYRGEGKTVSLVDAANLCHPKPTVGNREALALLMKGKLRSTETWESKLTSAGQAASSETEKDELKQAAWTSLILERKLGYFALLRNLRNILAATEPQTVFSVDVDGEATKQVKTNEEVLAAALQMLTNERLIKTSLVLPFRFLTALKEIEKTSFVGTNKVIAALSKAIDLALSNVPKFEGRTLVVLDVSGSMAGRPAEIGALFAATLVKACEADLITFSDKAQYRAVNVLDSVLTVAKSLTFAAGGTNFHSIFETARRAYARVVILSDMQGWIGQSAPVKAFADYKRRTNAAPKIYSFDLAGHGTTQFPEKDIVCLAGFSDKVFEVMERLEEDRDALVKTIEQIGL
ncbi:MAG: TROVE domain-containing protein [Rhizobacter sp.]|nr:TROVE domain-containing protein [Chlorobiales bacterium]